MLLFLVVREWLFFSGIFSAENYCNVQLKVTARCSTLPSAEMMAIAHKERHKNTQNVDTGSLEPSVDIAKILYREVFLNVDTSNFRFMSYRTPFMASQVFVCDHLITDMLRRQPILLPWLLSIGPDPKSRSFKLKTGKGEDTRGPP